MRISEFEDGSVLYSDTFFDETMDGPNNVWAQMYAYAKEHGRVVEVETIRFTKVFSQMAGETDKVVGFEMSGVLT